MYNPTDPEGQLHNTVVRIGEGEEPKPMMPEKRANKRAAPPRSIPPRN
jgi:hypothetical protein